MEKNHIMPEFRTHCPQTRTMFSDEMFQLVLGRCNIQSITTLTNIPIIPTTLHIHGNVYRVACPRHTTDKQPCSIRISFSFLIVFVYTINANIIVAAWVINTNTVAVVFVSVINMVCVFNGITTHHAFEFTKKCHYINFPRTPQIS